MGSVIFQTDSGKTFVFGKAGSNVYGMSIGTGMNVALGTSQGFSQIGETVQTESVGGRNIDVKGEFYGNITERKDAMRNVCAPMTSGRLLFWGKWFIRVHVKSAPTFSAKRGDGRFMLQFYAPFPFFSQIEEETYRIGEVIKQFRLPINYSVPHRFGTTSVSKATNVVNSGDVPVRFRLDVYARGSCQGILVSDMNTGEMMKINGKLESGDHAAVYYDDSGVLHAELNRDGETGDILAQIDDESNLFQLRPGANLLSVTSTEGELPVMARFSFNPARAVLYEA